MTTMLATLGLITALAGAQEHPAPAPAGHEDASEHRLSEGHGMEAVVFDLTVGFDF
jgi:hypothetical protein